MDSPDELNSLSRQMIEHVRRATQVYGPSSLVADLEQIAEALRRLAAEAGQTGPSGEATAGGGLGSDLPAMQRTVEREEFSRRLARQIESSLGQLVTNAVTELEYGIPLLRTDPATLEDGLRRLKAELQEGREAMRWLVADLRPPLLLADMGLGPSLTLYASHFENYAGLHIDTTTLREFHRRLPASVELGVFRIVQEALKNAHQHAGASVVHLRVEATPATITFSVEDDGVGFDSAQPAGELGLISMAERAAAIGGALHVLSRLGSGTVVLVSVPGVEGAVRESENRG